MSAIVLGLPKDSLSTAPVNVTLHDKATTGKRPDDSRSSATVSDSSLLSWLLGSRSCGGSIEPPAPRVIHMKRCEHCGVWSSDEICRCRKLLPPSSLDLPDSDPAPEALWQEFGGEA